MKRQALRIIVYSAKVLSAWIAIITTLWLVMESLFFCCIVNLFPYSARVSLGFGIYPLLQTSTSSIVPTHYTAIFGDSYAFGSGDWFMANQHMRNPTFSTTQLLHQQTGKDFISFGIPGSSNLSAWAEDPEAALAYLENNIRFRLHLPERILLYFYEGNDMQEGYMDFQARYIANGYKQEHILDPAYFDDFIEKEMLEKNPILLAARKKPLSHQLYFYNMAISTVRKFLDLDGSEAAMQQAIKNAYSQPLPVGNNQAIINGKLISLPDGISASPVDMDPVHIAETLRFIEGIAGHVRRRYPQADITIVYIPSYAMSYDMTSPHLNIYNNPPNTLYSTESIRSVSNQLCRDMQGIAERNQLKFLDTRPDILVAGKQQRLHGAFDIGHFDEAGYRVLAHTLETRLLPPANSPITACATL